jgi:hypothetical protein
MNQRFRNVAIGFCVASLVGVGSAFAFGGGGMGSKGGGTPELEGPVKVEKATGANAYTVAELHAQVAKLDKKQVVVRGKVVKVSKGIIKRNWIHLKDGTGDGETAKIVATSTKDAPAPGDVVTVKGTLTKDKDFGAGYFYKAIIEDAKIVK